MMALSVALALIVAGAMADAPPGRDALEEALECRAYTEMVKAMHPDDLQVTIMAEKMHLYWLKRGDELGREQKLGEEAVALRQLLIPLEADRYKDVMKRCLDATPRKALR